MADENTFSAETLSGRRIAEIAEIEAALRELRY
jgi:hypothetical protein